MSDRAVLGHLLILLILEVLVLFPCQTKMTGGLRSTENMVFVDVRGLFFSRCPSGFGTFWMNFGAWARFGVERVDSMDSCSLPWTPWQLSTTTTTT